MNLREFVIKKREEAKSEDLELSPDQLETMVDELKRCDEFKDTELRIMTIPTAVEREGAIEKNSWAKTVYLYEGTKFGKEAYLYKIQVEQGRIKVRGHFEYYQVPNESQPVKI